MAGLLIHLSDPDSRSVPVVIFASDLPHILRQNSHLTLGIPLANVFLGAQWGEAY